MDFMLLVKKFIAAIQADQSIEEVSVYTAMFILNTTKYEKVMPVLEYLQRKNILQKIGKKWKVVGR